MILSTTIGFRRPARRIGFGLLLAGALAGCSVLRLSPPQQTRQADLGQGAPLDRGLRPSQDDCDSMIRADQLAAGRIRAGVYGKSYPDPAPNPGELASDPQTVAVAAADPAARIDPELGIPLTQAERTVLTRSHVSDQEIPLPYWVELGAPERFGGVWIDPPGGDHYVVSIPHGDPATLALARCLETDGTAVRYVVADQPLAAGKALQDRVAQDWDTLRAAGVEMMGLGYLEDQGVLEISVKNPSDPVTLILLARYGPFIRVVQGSEIVDD